MTFTLWPVLAGLPIGLLAGWLGGRRLARHLVLAGMAPPRPATHLPPAERLRLLILVAAGAALLSLTTPGGDPVAWSQSLLLWCAIVPVAWIDLRTLLVDTPWLVGAMALRLGSVALLARADLLSALGGLLLAAGFFHILDVAYEAVRGRRGLGDGDPAVAGLLGAFVGPDALVPMVGLAAVAGLIGGATWLLAGRRGWSTPIPFAPFLALAGIAVYLARLHGWPLPLLPP